MWRISTPDFCGSATLQRQRRDKHGREKHGVLKNIGAESAFSTHVVRFVRTMDAEGQANLRKPSPNMFSLANLRLDDETANIARLRGRRATVASDAGRVGDRIRREDEGETVRGFLWRKPLAKVSTVPEID
jgi:hypothetical protein